ncbi:hypothetical protein AAX29_01104 [Aliarcobacter thereius]|uniref:Anti-bacteriophage protein A/HamA C-terminal domain-containing protein n=1 Tax=Aliarcobacter thereius TaxID=544718 RepID=A0A1C0B6Y3_9BACT|nr:Hachiman antiphage defense system protein HamA [Aliarcobacter thereius]OCL99292.1 hypothetical protein AAX29_01104 [Aliarcobacter thereius]
MRQSLKDLIDKTIIYKYSLPHNTIESVNLSNHKDDCYDYSNDDDLIKVIYNSIIEYSFNEFNLTEKDYLSIALQTQIRYKESDTETTKLSYGFYGEVLLFAMLYQIYKAKPIISRGYFFSPLEKSEAKGYDTFHLIENDKNVELWLGEVKFRQLFCCSKTSSVKSAIDGLEKALSDEYLKDNVLALYNFRNNFDIKNTKIEKILNDWNGNPIQIIDEIRKYNMTLVYPILLIYSDNDSNYDERIKKAVKKINDNFEKQSYCLSINYKLFFIFLPISEVKKIKQEVIEWIESKKPLLS